MWKPKSNILRIPYLNNYFKHKIKLKNLSYKYLFSLLFLLLLISHFFFNKFQNSKRYKPDEKINYNLLDLNNKNNKNDLTYDDLFNNNFKSKIPFSYRSFQSSIDDVFQYGCRDPLIEANKNQRENAAFVVLARNSEIDGVILSMRSLERRFNQWFNYPWIFINDEPFNNEFIERTKEVASGDLKFGLISKKNWNFKNNNDPLFKESIESQGDRKIMYGNLQSYHNMCRFYSGYFFEHPLIKNLDWYWRVEPDVEFYCDLTYDPFVEMKKNGKKYGYTIAIKELVNTVPNLFRFTKNFINQNNLNLPDSWNFFVDNYNLVKGLNKDKYQNCKNLNQFFNKLQSNSILNFSKLNLLNTDDGNSDDKGDDNSNSNSNSNIDNNLSNNDLKFLLSKLISNSKKSGLLPPVHEKFENQEYNLCHFWSNFEIASNDLFTSPEYKKYYDFLEFSKGFYTERWGDAPIHSLATGMLLNLNEIHYFRDIGYKHSTLAHCPFNSFENQLPYKSSPNFKHQVLPSDEILYANYDKPPSFEKSIKMGASGCRCRCPDNHIEIENSGGSCSSNWLKLTSDEFNFNNNLIGGLGYKNFLDLDKIEKIIIDWLYQWVKDGKKLKDWKLTDDQKKILSKIYK